MTLTRDTRQTQIFRGFGFFFLFHSKSPFGLWECGLHPPVVGVAAPRSGCTSYSRPSSASPRRPPSVGTTVAVQLSGAIHASAAACPFIFTASVLLFLKRESHKSATHSASKASCFSLYGYTEGYLYRKKGRHFHSLS